MPQKAANSAAPPLTTVDFDQPDDWAQGVSFFHHEDRCSDDPDCGGIGERASLAYVVDDDWRCDSQSTIDLAKRQRLRGRVGADTQVSGRWVAAGALACRRGAGVGVIDANRIDGGHRDDNIFFGRGDDYEKCIAGHSHADNHLIAEGDGICSNRKDRSRSKGV